MSAPTPDDPYAAALSQALSTGKVVIEGAGVQAVVDFTGATPTAEHADGAENDAPKVLDPNDLGGMHLTASGVRVTQVGEDGDVMLMGHHDDRTAWALFAEWRRYYDGEELTWEDSKVYDVERKYAAFSDHSEGCEKVNCGCAEQACGPCRAADHEGCDKGDYCECSAGYDHEFDGPWPCSCECYCDEYAWWVSDTKSGHEVTWVRWSWAKSKAQASVIPPGSGDTEQGSS